MSRGRVVPDPAVTRLVQSHIEALRREVLMLQEGCLVRLVRARLEDGTSTEIVPALVTLAIQDEMTATLRSRTLALDALCEGVDHVLGHPAWPGHTYRTIEGLQRGEAGLTVEQRIAACDRAAERCPIREPEVAAALEEALA